MTCIVSLITESSLHIKDGHIDLITILNIVWSCRPEVLRRHAIEMETHQRLSFFLLLVPMVRLEGELGTLLWVYMAGLALFGVNFFSEWPSSSSCAAADLRSCQLYDAHLILKGT